MTLFALLVLVYGCYVAWGSGPLVLTSNGWIQGVTDGDVDCFFGVPYGSIPQRFVRAVVPRAWGDHVWNATQMGPQCAQLAPDPRFGVSEDCLVVNVFRPAGVRHTNKTLVWIHGGAYFAGNAAAYDGRQLARQGALVVALQYRLAPFGFLPQAPNLGMFDQVLALEWVQRNAAAFGGTASRVTVAGESAGGGSVVALLASPLTRGLFHAAAALSPGSSQTFSCNSLLPYGLTVLQSCNCSTVACATIAPAECLLLGLVKATAGSLFVPFAPCVDGLFLQSAPAANVSSLAWVDRLLIGTVQDEGPLLVWSQISQPPGPLSDNPERVATWIAALERSAGVTNLTRNWYPMSRGPWRALADLVGDYTISCFAERLMAKVATHRYRFNAFIPGNPVDFLGATHGLDVPYWFDNSTVPYGSVVPPFPPAHAALASKATRWLLTFDDSPPNNLVTVLAVGNVTQEPMQPETPVCSMWNRLFEQTK